MGKYNNCKLIGKVQMIKKKSHEKKMYLLKLSKMSK